jgi:hypothetical protein
MKHTALPTGPLLVALLTLSLAACRTHQPPSSTVGTIPCPVLFDTAQAISSYRVLIRAGKTESSGLLILKYANNEWRGSLVSEAGSMKIFDLLAPQGKCRLKNPIPFLDKWYIRRTIASDFAFLLWTSRNKQSVRGKQLHCLPDSTFRLTNTARHIIYTFQPLKP